jgi:hypothetical protein
MTTFKNVLWLPELFLSEVTKIQLFCPSQQNIALIPLHYEGGIAIEGEGEGGMVSEGERLDKTIGKTKSTIQLLRTVATASLYLFLKHEGTAKTFFS